MTISRQQPFSAMMAHGLTVAKPPSALQRAWRSLWLAFARLARFATARALPQVSVARVGIVTLLLLASANSAALNLQYFRTGLLKSSSEDEIYPGGGYLSGSVPFQTSSPTPTCATNGPALTLGPAVGYNPATQVPAGDDCPKPADISGVPQFDNTIVRTFDSARYSYALNTDASGTTNNATITITLPLSSTAPAGRTVAVWNQMQSPPATLCASVSYSDSVVISGVTENRTLTCNLGNLPAARRMDITFNAKVLGSAKNGDVIPAPTATFAASNNAATVPFVEPTAPAGSPSNPPDMTVSATPRWDLIKEYSYLGGAVYSNASGPAGEDGVLMASRLVIAARGSRKGLEALDSTTALTLIDNLSLTSDDQGGTAAAGTGPRRNGKLVTWALNSNGPITSGCVGSARFTIDPTTGGSRLWNSYDTARDSNDNSVRAGAAGAGTYVSNGGICNAVQPDGAGTPINITITGADFTLASYPTNKFGTGAVLVNSLDADKSSNLWVAAVKGFFVWFPKPDFPVTSPPTPVNVGNAISQLIQPSVTGQQNVEPIFPSNNQWTVQAARQVSGSFQKSYTAPAYTLPGAQASEYAPCDPGIISDCQVKYVAPGQYYAARMVAANGGTEALNNVVMCEKLDNTRQTLVDATTATGTTYGPFTNNAQVYFYGPAQAYTLEYGMGGASNAAATWETQNTTTTPFQGTALTGSAQTDTQCADSNSTTWYSWTALKASGLSLQNVTKVRIKMPSLNSATSILAYIPLRARATFAFAASDNSPGTSHAAGSSTVATLIPNAGSLQTPTLITVANPNGLLLFGTTILIGSSENVAITKIRVNPATQVVAPAQIIRMRLQPNITSITDPHTATVTVTDTLPTLLTFISSSVTIGGVPAGDPSIALNTPFAGQTRLTWVLPNQPVPYGSPGIAAGNTPAIEYDARVAASAADGVSFLNAVTVASPLMQQAVCAYPTVDSGYAQPAIYNLPCAFSNLEYRAQINNGFNVNKRATPPVTDINQVVTFDTDLININTGSGGVPNAVIVDVLPFLGDTRSGGGASTFNGTIQLNVAVNALADGATDPRAVVKYSTFYQTLPVPVAQLTALSPDTPSAPDYWCTQAQLGTTNCPLATLADVKSYRVERTALSARVLYTSRVTLKPNGNRLGDIYVNDFAFGYSGVTTPLVSTPATATVTAATLSGRVWRDDNKDGAFNGTDVGIVTTITFTAKNGVDAYGNPVASVSKPTNADGTYTFSNLPAGEYTVVETQPSGYVDGLDYAGITGGDVSSKNSIAKIVIVAGGAAPNNNFTEYLEAPVSGRVYREGSIPANTSDDGNTVDPGLVTLVSMTCTAPSFGPASTQTAPDGSYTFSGVAAGANCTITEVQPTGYTNAYNTLGTGAEASTGGLPGTTNNSTISLVVPVAGSVNNNFAEFASTTVSGKVFVDINNNGLQDGADSGIGAVTISYMINGGVAQTLLTASDGTYSVTGVPVGATVVVTEMQPAAYGNGKTVPGTHGVATGGAASNVITVTNVPVEGSPVNNFGEIPGTISGAVWKDLTDNNTLDAGEALAGIAITLSGANLPDNYSTIVFTNSAGSYSFTGLPAGIYTVTEPTQPVGTSNKLTVAGISPGGTSGTVSESPSTIASIGLAAGATSPDNNFIENVPSVIRGKVYVDVNRSNTLDNVAGSSDTPLSGITIELRTTGNVLVASTVTAADGSYVFDGADAGNVAFGKVSVGQPYTVTELQANVTAAGYGDGSTHPGTNTGGGADTSTALNSISIFNLAPPGVAAGSGGSIDNNFGEVGATLSGRVWKDLNGGNVYNVGEELSGVPIDLYRSNTLVATTLTDSLGQYIFKGLPAGSYDVREPAQPHGTVNGVTQAGTTNAQGGAPGGTPGTATSTAITPSAVGAIVLPSGGDSPNNDFVENVVGPAITGTVYLDKDKNGNLAAPDTPLSGVTITLKDGVGNSVATTVTDGTGNYSFSGTYPGGNVVQGGVYTVEETQPVAYADGTTNPGPSNTTPTPNKIAVVVLPAGGSANNNFGEVGGEISGSVWKDLNGTSIKQAGEELGNVTIQLVNTVGGVSSVVATTTALADGTYNFSGLSAGNYAVIEPTQPPGTTNGSTVPGPVAGGTGTQTPGTVSELPSAINNIVMGAGSTSPNNNFIELVSSTISGAVYVDKDANGTKTAGDPPVPGVTLTLTGTDPSTGTPFTLTTTTDAAGNYTFSDPRIAAGRSYTVAETQPLGYGNAAERPTNVINIVNVSVAGSTGNNFGETLSSLAGSVWKDLNNDGVKDAGEALSGVSMVLTGTDVTGASVNLTVLTDVNGAYGFPDLKSGTYTVSEAAQPAGTSDGPTVPGSTGGTATPLGVNAPDMISAITLPVGTDSINNNFIELVTTDTTSAMVCTPSSAAPGASVKCTLACTNVGSNLALAATCSLIGTLPPGITANSCPAAPAASLAVAAALSCDVTFTAPLTGAITVTGGSGATNDSNGAADPGAGNNPSSGTVNVGTVNVSGRVYREGSMPANTSDDGNTVDPGLVTLVSMTCTAPSFGPASTQTAADGSYTFSGVAAGANCTITEAQPTGYTNAYNTLGTGAEASTGGLPGTTNNSTISLVVPVAGSVNNNFVEQSAADMVSVIACAAQADAPGASIRCSVTCTNNGLGTAAGASCSTPNGSTLPGYVAGTCPLSGGSVLHGGVISCHFLVAAPLNGALTVRGGTGAINDTNGGTDPALGNNHSSVSVSAPVAATPEQPIPTASAMTLLLLALMVAMIGVSRRRQQA